MTDFSDVNVGDRVRLTHENGDLAEFTITRTNKVSGTIESQSNAYALVSSFWTVEILERAAEKLPTGQYAVVGHKDDPDWNPYIRINGEWFEVDATLNINTKFPEEEIREMIRNHGFEVLYEGIQ